MKVLAIPRAASLFRDQSEALWLLGSIWLVICGLTFILNLENTVKWWAKAKWKISRLSRVSSFQNKSNCGRLIIVISLFFYKKYLFHSEISLFKQSQEKDDLSLSHRIRWSEDQSISECSSWRGSFLCTWTKFLRWHIQNGTHSAIKVTSTSEILTFTLCNLHKIVIKDVFSLWWMTFWRNADSSKYRISTMMPVEQSFKFLFVT